MEGRSVREAKGGFLPKAATPKGERGSANDDWQPLRPVRSVSSCCLKFGRVTFASRKKCLGLNDGPANAIMVQIERLTL
jgi:hypothetical protein